MGVNEIISLVLLIIVLGFLIGMAIYLVDKFTKSEIVKRDLENKKLKLEIKKLEKELEEKK